MDIDWWANLRRSAGNLIAFSAYLQASCLLLDTNRHKFRSPQPPRWLFLPQPPPISETKRVALSTRYVEAALSNGRSPL